MLFQILKQLHYLSKSTEPLAKFYSSKSTTIRLSKSTWVSRVQEYIF